MDQLSIPRYDMLKAPVRTKWYLRPITYLLSAPDVRKHQAKIVRQGTEALKPPYLMLCNHNAFLDFKVATKAIYPQRANYVVAIDGFIGREKLLRDVGCICTRKFTNDLTLVRNLQEAARQGSVVIMYPEARYSLCGTTAVLPESLGKLAKLLKIPVVSFVCHGHHINQPYWNLHERGVRPTEAEMTLLFTAEEVQNATADEINQRLVEAFQYDEYSWQKERGIRVSYKGRAEGLEKVLYQCPACGKEFKMASKGSRLFCGACGKVWQLSELMELEAEEGETEFTHIPDWYEWERTNVRKEVEEGRYNSGELPVKVMSLPNAKRFIDLGEGTMVHNMDGFLVKGVDKDGDPFEMVKSVPSLYSCHIEYDYLGKYGDLVDLNTLEDTWYVRPQCEEFAVTKMALATEELYCRYRAGIGKPCKKGLA